MQLGYQNLHCTNKSSLLTSSLERVKPKRHIQHVVSGTIDSHTKATRQTCVDKHVNEINSKVMPHTAVPGGNSPMQAVRAKLLTLDTVLILLALFESSPHKSSSQGKLAGASGIYRGVNENLCLHTCRCDSSVTL